MLALWNTLGGKEPFTSSRAKGAEIRNPSIRYMHRVVASTLFARKNTGTENDGELQMLEVRLKEILLFAPTGKENKMIEMKRDVSGTGNTIILVNQLMYYKDNARKIHKMGYSGSLAMGESLPQCYMHATLI